MTELLKIENLHVGVNSKEILKGLDLTVNKGEVHVVMGPNGAGKSTLANAIMAHPLYDVTEGDIIFEGQSILEDKADERARKGIFMSFQQPPEVPGINQEEFLRTARAKKDGKKPQLMAFKKEVIKKMEDLSMGPEYAERYLNVGFSGGEKKKNEILQMKILDPKLIMLDETDSGLDVDAVRIVSKSVSEFLNEDKSCIIITHISGILEFIKPDFVHVIIDGKIVYEGGPELIDRINKEGYEWIREKITMEETHA